MENNEQNIIDLKKIFTTLWEKRKVFYWVWGITFVVACIYIFPQPRYYTCQVKLAPEGAYTETGGVGNIVSALGVNLGSMPGGDAICPLLYPELFESPEFLVGLFDIQICSADGEIKTDYYNYRKKHPKHNPYTYPIRLAKTWIITHLLQDDTMIKSGKGEKGHNSFMMSKGDFDIMNSMSKDITCSIDQQTNVIVLTVRDQDPMICALMADSVKTHLKDFICTYRTKKAREDAEYYSKLLVQAEQDYNQSVNNYCNYMDSHNNVNRQVQMTEAELLRNEMQLQYSVYNTLKKELISAQAKIQEKTPAFTTLKSATIPVRATSPKRLVFVFAMLFMATIIASSILAWDEICEYIKNF